jgi:hypothetical protein
MKEIRVLTRCQQIVRQMVKSAYVTMGYVKGIQHQLADIGMKGDIPAAYKYSILIASHCIPIEEECRNPIPCQMSPFTKGLVPYLSRVVLDRSAGFLKST